MAEATVVGVTRHRRPSAPIVVGATVGALALVVALAPAWLPYGSRKVVGKPFEHPLSGHLLGTDSQGRDVLVRSVLGLRTSLGSAFIVIAIGLVVGTIIGLAAGFAGGIVDTVLMRITDVALALPGPVVALAIAAALGPGLGHTLIAVAAFWWPWYARIVRGQVQSIRKLPDGEAASLGGLGSLRVATAHVLPGTVGPVVIAASLDIGAVVLVLAGLSFLGLGSPAPAAELGAMTSQGLQFLFNAPWISLCPAVGLFLLAASGNILGDLLRDRLAKAGSR